MGTRKGNRVLGDPEVNINRNDKIASIGAHSARIGGFTHEEKTKTPNFSLPASLSNGL